MIVGQAKPSLDELAHHGVLGMKWGHHKAPEAPLPTHPSYTKGKMQNDTRSYGKHGVARINAQLHAGASLKDARQAEHARKVRQYNTVAASVITARLLQMYGPTLVSAAKLGIATAAHNNRMKAGQTAIRALGATATKVPYAKIVKGAYKITTMK